jgi:sulfide dehydrogenase [flavocytochrome c] flavoprotein chain
MTINRREFLKAGSAAAALSGFSGCASIVAPAGPRVVVVGGGYAGATAAKYLRKWGPNIEVVLIERNVDFISCPVSNLVLGGSKTLADITSSYAGLGKYGVRLVRDEAVAVDTEKRVLRLAGGESIGYDRLIVAPGVDFIYELVPGLNSPQAQSQILHAWKAGAQTVALRKQLEAMRDGGVVAISIPEAPYRCPPGPYERACQIASYFKQAKPRSKVLILDANGDVTSKGALFKKVWAEMYPGLVEHRPNSKLVDVDVKTNTAKLELEDVSADVLNVLPPMKAGRIAELAGVITANKRWCEVDFLTYESLAVKNVHVLGDAIQIAPAMPKSGHMANAHGKACAAAVIALLSGEAPNPNPTLTNTCYSYVSADKVIHVNSVHRYDAEKKTMLAVPGSVGLSPAPNELEAGYAMTWARNIWADMLG